MVLVVDPARELCNARQRDWVDGEMSCFMWLGFGVLILIDPWDLEMHVCFHRIGQGEWYMLGATILLCCPVRLVRDVLW